MAIRLTKSAEKIIMNEALQQKLKESGYEGDFSLSSLIQSCSNGQFALSKIPEAFSGWRAIMKDGELKARGETPEIAVANLFILSRIPKENKEIKQI